MGQNRHLIADSRRSLNFRHPRKDPGLAALERRLGWPAVMAEGCRWIIGEPCNGTWKWCSAPCVADRGTGATAWCADHWRLVYMIDDVGIDPDQSTLQWTQIEGRRRTDAMRRIRVANPTDADE